MTQVTIIGCDLHDRSMLLKIALGADDPHEKSFSNNSKGRGQMLEHLIAFAQQHGSERMVFVYEASGQGFGLYDLLTDRGIECHVLSPTHLPKTAKSKRNKTDAKDAQMLLEIARAHVLAGNAMPTVWIPPQRVRDDRELVRTRLQTGEAITQVKLQTLALLKRQHLATPEWFDKHHNWTKAFVAWLKKDAADQLDPTARVSLTVYIERYELFQRQSTDLERELRQLAKQPRYKAAYKKLRSMRGVGLITAMTFLTELGDLTRFNNRRELGAYLGVCPSSFESGESNDRKGRITRQGPSRLRKVLNQASWAAVRYDEETKARWARIKGKGKHRGKKAIVAIMRQLGIRMWHAAASMGVSSELMQKPRPAPCWTLAPAQQKGESLSSRHRHGPQ